MRWAFAFGVVGRRVVGGLGFELFARGVEEQVAVAEGVGGEGQVVEADGDRLGAEAEEAADIDDHGVEAAIGIGDDVADGADLLVIDAIDANAAQFVGGKAGFVEFGEAGAIERRADDGALGLVGGEVGIDGGGIGIAIDQLVFLLAGWSGRVRR